jgi:spore coat protein CotH
LKEIQQTKEYKFNKNMKLLIRSDDKEEFRGDFFQILGQNYNDQDDEEVANVYRKFYKDSMKSFDKRLLLKIDAIISKFENR